MDGNVSDPPMPPPRGRHGLSRREVDLTQRSRLIAAMTSVAARRGFHAATIADVLAEARMSRTTFYQQFTDKEDCFLATFDACVEQIAAEAGAARAASTSWSESVHRSLRALFTSFAEQPDIGRICMVQAPAAGPRALARYEKMLLNYVAIIEAEGVTYDDFPAVPRSLIETLVGGIASIAFREISADRADHLPGRAEEITLAFVAAMIGHSVAVELVNAHGLDG